MNLRYLVITLAIVGLANSALAETKPILGPGAGTCGTWTQERKETQYPHKLGWVDNYCSANPLDSVYTVSIALIRELERRDNSK